MRGWLSWSTAMLLLWPMAMFAAGPEPTVKIPLAPLKYLQRQMKHMPANSALYTLNFVDNTHLLFTYTTHGMLLRIPGDPVEDEDRNVEALLLELPSGKVVTQTTLRLHDYRPFLWELGDGRFLLRTRNKFETLAPLADMNDSWAKQPLFQFADDLIFRDLQIPQDRGVLVVEMSLKPPPVPPGQGRPRFAPQPALPVVAEFIRLLAPEDPHGAMRARMDTSMQRNHPTDFSLTSTGFMEIKKGRSGLWGFDFREFNGKQTKLAGLKSSCAPSPVFVSATEFVTFGCRGRDDKSSLTGFNLAGQVSWSMDFGEAQSYSMISAATGAGRFAISRSTGDPFHAPASTGQIEMQEVRVLQGHNGTQLLRVECSPIQATGHNFALSADGLHLAVVQDAIAVYSLPALSREDQRVLAASKAREPKLAPELKVDLGGGAPELPWQPFPPEAPVSAEVPDSSHPDIPYGPVKQNPQQATVLPPSPAPASDSSTSNASPRNTPGRPAPMTGLVSDLTELPRPASSLFRY